jgi:hypothetical protein
MLRDEAEATKAWTEAVDAIDKAEDDFTAADWRKVAAAGIPF